MKYSVIKYTRKEIRRMITDNTAIDLTNANMSDYEGMIEYEDYFDLVGVATGIYGITAKLLRGHRTRALYAIGDRTKAIYIF